jgi:hypothetical protein
LESKSTKHWKLKKKVCLEPQKQNWANNSHQISFAESQRDQFWVQKILTRRKEVSNLKKKSSYGPKKCTTKGEGRPTDFIKEIKKKYISRLFKKYKAVSIINRNKATIAAKFTPQVARQKKRI